jgi:hypothetical protein
MIYVALTLQIEDISNADTTPTHFITFSHFLFSQIINYSRCVCGVYMSVLRLVFVSEFHRSRSIGLSHYCYDDICHVCAYYNLDR